jgi:hypothetical protein
LQKIGYIREIKLQVLGFDLLGFVGRSAVAYEPTADGFEIIARWHPPVLLRLRAWIAVLPPWLVLLGTIAGGVAAVWQIINLIRMWAGAV